MTTSTRWVISVCWIVVTLVAFLAADASSVRSWLFLMTAAFVPPAVLNALWREEKGQTIAEVMRGGRS